MVIPIDAIRSGAGFTATAQWQLPPVEEPAEPEWHEDAAPVRGVVCGLALSVLLWVALIAAVRAIAALLA